MFKIIHVNLGERVVVFKNGIPTRVLAPGKHRLWGTGLDFSRLDTSELLLDVASEVRAVLPKGSFEEVTIGPRQRAMLHRDGQPACFLGPGVYRYWTLEPGVSLRVMSIDEDVPTFTDAELALVPKTELCIATVLQNQRGLLYVQGRFMKLLDPGRYVLWSNINEKAIIVVIDMRTKQVTIAGQELMTRDKVTLRLTLTAEFSPSDAPTLAHSVADPEASIYLIVQLAARDYVAGVTLDELLEGRDAMSKFLLENTVSRAREFGIEVSRVGVKDIVLPGEMKALLNRVIEAEKQAAANVILRREEVATTRTMANAAKVIADNPTIMTLKKLDALKEIAGGINDVRVFVGAEGLESLVTPMLE